jgi:hypothetical protein
MYIYFEPLELRKIFCRDDGTRGVCKLDDLSPYGYNFSICRKELFNRGIKFVNDFVNVDGSFLTLDQFSNKFGFCVNLLQYNGVISSL